MTRSCLVAALVAKLGVANLAPAEEAPSGSSRSLEQQLLQMNRAAADMQVRKDAAAADRLLADDYVFLQADGQVSNKAQNIAVLRDPAFVCESVTTEDVKVRLFHGVAVVTGRIIMRANYRGQDVGGEFLYTDVWAKRDGRWQTVVSQATRRPR
jgi:ketosteroid isomerase-like protein